MAKKKHKIAKIGEQVIVEVPSPEDSVYLRPDLTGGDANPVLVEKHDLYPFKKVEYPAGGGIHLWLKGLKYPIKGFPEPENVAANNIAKRILINQVKIWAKYPLSACYLLTNKGRNLWFREYLDIIYPVIERALYEPSKYNNLSRELFKMVPIFLKGIGIQEEVANVMGHVVAAMIEHDDAYRYRIEDLLSETNKDFMMKYPAKEMAMMVKVLGERDNRKHLVQKFDSIRRILTIAFWLPSVKKAFRDALSVCNFEHMQLDEIDRYHTLRYSTYDFAGLPFDERYAVFLQMHGGKEPKSIPMNQW